MATAVLTLSGAGVVLAVSVSGMLRGTEPYATWFYPLAWYPTLAAFDAIVRLRSGRWYLADRPWFALAVLAWSVPFWLFFELLNLRMANWYYVFLPSGAVARWVGIVVSFGTVLPAILASRRLLESFGVGDRIRWPPLSRALLRTHALQGLGVGFVALALAWPDVFYPLIWGAVTLLVDPWVYRRDPSRSLLGALERGRPGVILQLLLGGLVIGLLWELYNTRARGHWIYTVPGLEELKLFEMPLLGFLGFPVLALDGWAVWNALVLAGLATEGKTGVLRRRLLTRLAVPVVAASVAVTWMMDVKVVTSVTPDLEDLAASDAEALESAGYDVFRLARADAAGLALATGRPKSLAADWVRRARLVSLRGIGVENAAHLERAGVGSVEELAGADAEVLTEALTSLGASHVQPARVRVWIRGANGAR